MSHGYEMICQPVALSGYAEWPKVADAVIEARDAIHTCLESVRGLLLEAVSSFLMV